MRLRQDSAKGKGKRGKAEGKPDHGTRQHRTYSDQTSTRSPVMFW
jgi:hypothetical protein